jgi:uncharacterized membrane protein YqgA involved in biofilm formation
MIAVFINVGAVLLGSMLGLAVGKAIKEDLKDMVMAAAGMFTIFIGLKMAFKTQRELYVILSLVIGGGIGSLLGIEAWFLRLGDSIKKRLPGGEGQHAFSEGFLAASMLFCVGAMSIIGSFNAGTTGDMKLILIKSVLDGFMAIILAGRFGLGVALSSLTILVYQGTLTLLARWLQPLLPELAQSEISGTGGVMVMMIGFGLLNVKKIKTGDFLPALVVVVLFCLADPWLKSFLV